MKSATFSSVRPKLRSWHAALALALALLAWLLVPTLWEPEAVPVGTPNIASLCINLKTEYSAWDRWKYSTAQFLRAKLLKQRCLTTSDAELRLQAAITLQGLGPQASNAVAALVWGIAHERNPIIIHHELMALGRIGPSAVPAVPSLLNSLSASGPRGATWRRGAAWALARIAPGDANVASALVNAFGTCATNVLCSDVFPEDFNRNQRWGGPCHDQINLIRAIALLQPQTVDSRQLLYHQLQLGDYCARVAAADALGGLRPVAAESVAKLIDQLRLTRSEYPPEQLKEFQFREFWFDEMEPADRVDEQEAIALLKDERPGTNALFFGSGDLAATGLDILYQPVAGFAGWGLRKHVLRALAHIGPEARDALPFLASDYEDNQSVLRFDAAAAAWSIGGPTPGVLLLFEQGITAPELRTRQTAFRSLAQLAREKPQAAALLFRGFSDPNRAIRCHVMTAAGNLGTNGLAAIPAFRALQQDPSLLIRYTATEALQSLPR